MNATRYLYIIWALYRLRREIMLVSLGRVQRSRVWYLIKAMEVGLWSCIAITEYLISRKKNIIHTSAMINDWWYSSTSRDISPSCLLLKMRNCSHSGVSGQSEWTAYKIVNVIDGRMRSSGSISERENNCIEFRLRFWHNFYISGAANSLLFFEINNKLTILAEHVIPKWIVL